VVGTAMRKAREPSERLWRGTVSNLGIFSGGGTHGSRRAVVVQKTCKIWRTTRAKRFECYFIHAKFNLDTMVTQRGPRRHGDRKSCMLLLL